MKGPIILLIKNSPLKKNWLWTTETPCFLPIEPWQRHAFDLLNHQVDTLKYVLRLNFFPGEAKIKHIFDLSVEVIIFSKGKT